MEKIININMAGRVIAIEDRAYSRLTAYLESLRAYFAAEDGRDEILADIESRIAELMAEKMRRGAAAIGSGDIEEIITGMGSAEDFAAADAEEGAAPAAGRPRFTTTGKHRRFFRDTNDKLFGGVCSGLASYLNVDPALVRIVFAILTFGGWGSGLLLYIALWIIVPAMPLEAYQGKRLFRNSGDKWMGGVCSGLGAYFGRDPMIFRGIFLLPVLLSIFSNVLGTIHGTSIVFGSFTGTFLLIYIVLWVVLPIATSDFEKMEMRGEKVDLSSIRNNVYAGMGDTKTRVRAWSSEATTSASQFLNTRGRAFAHEAATAAKPLAARGGRVIAAIFKAFFLMIGGVIALTLFLTLAVYSFSGMPEFVNDFFLSGNTEKALAWATVILFAGVPIVGALTWIIRNMMRVKTGGAYLGWTFAGLWLIGLGCAGVLGVYLRGDFNRYEKVSQDIAIAQPSGGKLILEVPGDGIQYHQSVPWLHGNIDGFDVVNDSMLSARVQVKASLSPDSLYHVSVHRYSAGSNTADARARAGRITYAVSGAGDSIIALGNGYSITAAQKFRGQKVVVEIFVPAGRKLRIDHSVINKLSGAGFASDLSSRSRYNHRRWSRNWDDVDYRWQPDVDYVMTTAGELQNGALPETRIMMASHREIKDDLRRRRDSLERIADEIERQKNALDDAED